MQKNLDKKGKRNCTRCSNTALAIAENMFDHMVDEC
jgi:hypothetical protein